MPGERTPLLLRSNKGRNADQQQQEEGLILGSDYAASSEDNLFLPVSRTKNDADDDDDKADRRGWSGRMGSFLTSQMRRGQSLTTVMKTASPARKAAPFSRPNEMLTQQRMSSDEEELYRPLDDDFYARNQGEFPDEDDHSDACNCTFGTRHGKGIWWNGADRIGSLMAITVWILMLYSMITVLLLVKSSHISALSAAVFITLTTLALASHAKTALTDPGSIPPTAVPVQNKLSATQLHFHSMCSQCQSYKPEIAHHCRICNRCISRMDHHCPWMNNCVGVSNYKHFILFNIYTWFACITALIQFAVNYFFCFDEMCEFSPKVEIHLVHAMSFLCVGTLLFTTSILLNVQYGVITGVGTIDRLKKKAAGAWEKDTSEPMKLVDIFGDGSVYTWWLPVDPVFSDFQRVYGFSTNRHAKWQEAAPRRRQFDGLEPVDI